VTSESIFVQGKNKYGREGLREGRICMRALAKVEVYLLLFSSELGLTDPAD